MQWRAIILAAVLAAACGQPGQAGSTGSDTDSWFGDDPTDLDAEKDNDEDANPVEAASGDGLLAELCGGQGVLFCDDFEHGLHPGWDADSGHTQIVEGSVVTGEGHSVLELLTYEDVPSSKLLYRFENQDRLYARYDVQYAADYDEVGSSVLGPRIGGSEEWWGSFGRQGEKPLGNDFFVLFVVPTGPVVTRPLYALLGYFANMHPDTTGTYWGNELASTDASAPTLVRGRWQCVELGIELNDPSLADGRAGLWVDGVDQGPFESIQWRTIAELGTNVFVLDSYNEFAMGARPRARANSVRYDNVVLSTRRIGCLGMPTR